MGVPKIFRDAGATPDPVEICPDPMCHLVKVVRARSNGMSVVKEIIRKIWALASRLSRPLKVSGTNTDQSATCDFLLVTHGPVLYYS